MYASGQLTEHCGRVQDGLGSEARSSLLTVPLRSHFGNAKYDDHAYHCP